METAHSLHRRAEHRLEPDEQAPVEAEAAPAAGPSLAVAGLATVRRAEPADHADPLGGTAAAPDVVSALQRRRGKGQPLPDDVAARFGAELGADLGGVRVHADHEADHLARSVQATAFTHGSDIYFAANTYAPDTRAGQHLLAHELTHTVQQSSGSGSASGPTIGRADDPAEAHAEASARRVVGALQRRTADPPTPSSPTVGGLATTGTIHRLGWGKKKKTDESDTPVVQTAGEKFAEAVKGKKPKDEDEARERMEQLRVLLEGMTSGERSEIANDKKLMAKGRTFVGQLEYMALLGAVGMAYKSPNKKKAKNAVDHMSGAEADTFIQQNMGAIPHLKPFLDKAVSDGKKADGYIAVVGDDDWKESIVGQGSDKMGSSGEKSTNAFIGNKNVDRPAIINWARGTRSTAVHESMHRYSVLNVLRTFGFRLNEGMTEYFTRLIINADGTPVTTGTSTRTNYQDNWEFISDHLVPMLGSGQADREKSLAEIYFSGSTDLLKTKFIAACKKKKVATDAANDKWTDFEAAIKEGNWTGAANEIPT